MKPALITAALIAAFVAGAFAEYACSTNRYSYRYYRDSGTLVLFDHYSGRLYGQVIPKQKPTAPLHWNLVVTFEE